MNLKTYAQIAPSFAVYPKETEREYLSLGLIGEAGELASIRAKELRGDAVTADQRRELLISEGGDILWFLALMMHANGDNISEWTDYRDVSNELPYLSLFDCATLASEGFQMQTRSKVCFAVRRILAFLPVITGASLEDIAAHNAQKLNARQKANAIKGSGESLEDRIRYINLLHEGE